MTAHQGTWVANSPRCNHPHLFCVLWIIHDVAELNKRPPQVCADAASIFDVEKVPGSLKGSTRTARCCVASCAVSDKAQYCSSPCHVSRNSACTLFLPITYCQCYCGSHPPPQNCIFSSRLCMQDASNGYTAMYSCAHLSFVTHCQCVQLGWLIPSKMVTTPTCNYSLFN
jgi:hypothetical protein